MALVVVGPLVDNYTLRLVTDAVIFALFGIGVNLLLGYVGLPSLGHAAFYGLAAYAASVWSKEVVANFWVATAVALSITGGFGAIYGALAVRTRGVYFLMVTLAVAELLRAGAIKLKDVTGGSDGLAAVPRPDLGPLPWKVTDPLAFYYLTVAVFLMGLVSFWLMSRSSFGLALKGIRENEERMLSLGYDAWRLKVAAFVLSALYTGLAGVLHAYHLRFVSPEILSLLTSARALLTAILGGAGTVLGPVFGAFLLTFVEHLVESVTERWMMVLGLLYVLTVLAAPTGLGPAAVRGVQRARVALTRRMGGEPVSATGRGR